MEKDKVQTAHEFLKENASGYPKYITPEQASDLLVDFVKMHFNTLKDKIQNQRRHSAITAGGCECCGTWAEMEEDTDGEWINRDFTLQLLDTENIK